MMAILLVLLSFLICIEAKGGKCRGCTPIFCFSSDCEWWEYLFTAIFTLLVVLGVAAVCLWGFGKLKERYSE